MAANLADDNFKCILLNENDRYPNRIALTFVPRSPIDNKFSIGIGNGLAQKRRQTITWTNADLVRWRIYAALGGDGLNCLLYPYSGSLLHWWNTVYPKKYAHGFVVLCFVVVIQSFIINSHEVFVHIHQGCFAGTGAIVRLPQCQWSKPDGYGKISQCITTTKHSKAVTVCIFLGIYCSLIDIGNTKGHQTTTKHN